MKSLFALVLLLLAGCAVGPDYRRPEVTAPETWMYADTATVIDSSALAVADTAWWELFGDSVMTSLIHTVLQENNDIRIAAARVEQYMGLYGVTKSDFFPKIDASASGLRGQSFLSGDGSTTRPTRNLFDVSVGASWEIDLWGKIRRATEAARADLLGQEEARRGVVLSIVTITANSYISLLALDRQLEIAQKTVELRAHTLDLFRQRRAKGDISDLELSQIESEYWLARARIPQLRKSIAQLENGISVLLGRNPGPIPRGELIDSLQLPVVPEGVPSALLARRPDVREAEEALIAANARVGVAKALYFPSISLTGLFGTSSQDLSNLFTPNAQIWNVGGQVLQPIFHWGEISGQVDAAEAVKKQLLYGYVQAVQNAFRDAEDALVNRSRTEEQLSAETNRVAALQVYADLARMRYKEGVTSYLEVLDAERSLFSTQLERTETQSALFRSVVGIYGALAGGWVDRVAADSFQPADPVEQR